VIEHSDSMPSRRLINTRPTHISKERHFYVLLGYLIEWQETNVSNNILTNLNVRGDRGLWHKVGKTECILGSHD
jgi:hypothetical protein